MRAPLRQEDHPARDGKCVATRGRDVGAAINEQMWLQTLIDWVPDYLYIKDTDSRFVVVNKALAFDSGRASASEIIGLTDFDIHDSDSARKFRAIEQEILRTGRPMIDFEEFLVTSSGATKWILSTKAPLRNDRGEIIALVGNSRDITELHTMRNMANERVTLQALIDFLPDSLWVKDAASRFLICNRATVARMGYADSDELIGRTDLELLSPDIAQKFFDDEQTIVRTGQPRIDIEECVFGSGGEKTWILTTKVPLRDNQNNIFGVAGISRDITERKRLTQEKEYRIALLHAVSVAAKELLTTQAIGTVMATVLTAIGEAARGDRVLVFENHTSHEGVVAFGLRYSWHSPQAPVIVDAALIETMERDTFGLLEEGQARSAVFADVVGSARSTFLNLGIRSNVVVPIIIEGKVWGRVGIDDCTTEREWDPIEVDILRIVADMIGAAIIRDRHVHELRNANTIIESSPTMLFRLSGEPSLPLIYISNNVTMYGYEPAAMLSSPLFYQTIIHPDDTHRVMESLTQTAMAGTQPAEDQFRMRANNGAYIWLESRFSPVRDVTGQLLEIEGLLTDVSEKKIAADRIFVLATTDDVTGLANRATFMDRLQHSFTAARRAGPPFAVLYLDLDRFKEVNDTLGHSTGDLLLRSVAKRLLGCVRETDLVGRLGGDEFAVLQTNLTNLLDAEVLASKILDALSVPYPLDGKEAAITVSIGISSFSSDAGGADELLAQADLALYRAKKKGRNHYCFHTDDVDRESRLRVAFVDDLKHAMDGDELELCYQPELDLATHRVVGMKALIRWRHPTRGLLEVAAFLPLIETTPLALTLGMWVIDRACEQRSAWRREGFVLPTLAAKLSLKQLHGGREFVDYIKLTLAKWALAPEDLEFDVTEAALAHFAFIQNNVLDQLRQVGVKIAFDDFGTQYSCLDYLNTYGIDRVKMPDSLIDASMSDPETAAKVRAIVGVCRKLGIGVVARRLDTEKQRTLLRRPRPSAKVLRSYYSAAVSAAQATSLLRQSAGGTRFGGHARDKTTRTLSKGSMIRPGRRVDEA